MTATPPSPRSITILGHGLAGALLAETASAAGIRVRVCDTGLASASQVAAGLFTPVTGQHLRPGWAVEEALPVCHRVFGELATLLETPLITRLPTLRIFSSAAQRDEFAGRKPLAWIRPAAPGPLPVAPPPHGAVWIEGGGWLNLPLLLERLRDRRRARGEWGEGGDSDLTVHCTGAHAATDPLWREAGWRNAHGDVLTVRIPGLPQNCIYSFEKFLLPLGDGCFRLGATYAWDLVHARPTVQGRLELEEALRDFTPLPYEVLDHRAGLRPVAVARVPIAGPHPDQPREWILNGFASKGVLYAPWICGKLISHWLGGEPLPRECWAPRRILRQRALSKRPS